MRTLLANRLYLGYALFVNIGSFLGMLVFGIIWSLTIVIRNGVSDPQAAAEVAETATQNAWQDIFQLGMALSMLVFAWIVWGYVKRYRRILGWDRALRPAPTLLLTITILAFNQFYVAFLLWFAPPRFLRAAFKPYDASSLWGYAAAAVVYIILAPLIEEWLFRGIMLRSYASARGPAFALAASAFLFAVLHIAPITVIFALGMGYLFGRWVLSGGGLLETFTAHAFNNSVSFALSICGAGQTLSHRASSTAGIAGLLGGLAIIWLFTRWIRFKSIIAKTNEPILSLSLATTAIAASVLFLFSLSEMFS